MTSLMLRNICTLRMLSYDHQGGGVGGGVLAFLTSTSLTLRNKLPLLTCCTCFLTRFCWISSSSVVTADGARGFTASCVKDYPHKRFKMAQVNHKQNIFTKTYHFRGRLIFTKTKTYHFRGRLWGKSYRTIVAGTHKKLMEHGNTSKYGDLCRCSTKKSLLSVPKKVHLGLQLDMASQCCLVAVCGFCIATNALALKRREKEKNDERMSP